MKIARPMKEVRKFLMAVARRKTENRDNHFWIDVKNGTLRSSGYLQGNGDYFPHTPQGTYEVRISYEPFLSYAQLDSYIEAGIELFMEENDF